jgi:predicted dehydrogenase
LAAHAGEAERMFEAAERNGRLLVEAFMYRCHPLTEAVLQRVREGAIGRLQLVRASFCYATKRIEGNTRFDPALAGGALMDIGCYCLDLARLAVGAEPESATAVAALHDRGVDERASGVLRFPGDALATFSCGMTVQTDNTAYLCGDEGYIAIPVPWKPPREGASYMIKGMAPPRQDRAPGAGPREQTHTVDSPLPLFAQEAAAFAAAVAGERAPAVSAAESLANMRLLDDLRKQVGVTIPGARE